MTSIIDTAYGGKGAAFFRLEDDGKLYRTTNIGGGSATWSTALDAAIIGGAEGLTNLKFTRVRAVGQKVKVLGFADSTVPGYSNAYVFRSSSNGSSWSYSKVAENTASGELPFDIVAGEAFTASNASSSATGTASGTGGSISCGFRRTWGGEQWPSISTGDFNLDPPSYMSSCKIKVTGTPTNWGFSDGGTPADGASRPAFFNGSYEGYNHGTPAGPTAAAEYVYTEAVPEIQTKISFVRGHAGDSRADGILRNYAYTWEITEWNGASIGSPTAFDMAPANPAYVYVGLKEGIYVSMDDGETWELKDETAIYDLAVHPVTAGVATCWCEDGSLKQMVGGVLGAALMTEDVPLSSFGRIAYSPDGGVMFVLASMSGGIALRKRKTGGWTDLLTGGPASARSLRCYRKSVEDGSSLLQLAWVDVADINFCWNADIEAPEFQQKKGAWAWGSPISIDLP